MKRKLLQMMNNYNSSHECISGQAFVWGDGEEGQLGLGDKRSLFEPVMLQGVKDGGATREILQEVEWRQIACGSHHTVAVTPKGDVFTWGDCVLGQLGHGDLVGVDTPKQVVTGSLVGKAVVYVACGSYHTAVVTSEGELHTCGLGECGQLGHGNLDNISTFSKVEGLEGHSICQVACGREHTVVLTSDGIVYSFGSNEEGQTGHGVTEGYQSTPKKVNGCLESKKAVLVASHNNHVACITEDGDTYTWGKGEFGRLGHGDETSRSTPKLVDGLVGKKAKEVACGEYHTIVLTEDGRVYSFGHGENGQLGHCNFENQLTPSLITVPLERKCVVQVACGWGHSMALTFDGYLYTWGDGESLGHGSDINYCVPSIVESLVGYNVIHIASKYIHSVALVDDSKRCYAKKMKSMINDETCSDVVFVLKDGERAHAMKGFLVGQSEYFRAMFRSGMKESKENVVEVRDCSKRVFLLFLEYLYLGEVDIVIDNAIELYVLSDRYQEIGLSRLCLGAVERGLSDANAIKLLVEADGVGLVDLKNVCMEYVVSNYGSIEKEGIDSLSPSLMSDLLKSL